MLLILQLVEQMKVRQKSIFSFIDKNKFPANNMQLLKFEIALFLFQQIYRMYIRDMASRNAKTMEPFFFSAYWMRAHNETIVDISTKWKWYKWHETVILAQDANRKLIVYLLFVNSITFIPFLIKLRISYSIFLDKSPFFVFLFFSSIVSKVENLWWKNQKSSQEKSWDESGKRKAIFKLYTKERTKIM